MASKSNAALGYVRGEPLAYVRGHSSRRKSGVDWIEEDRGYSTPCWIWQRGMANDYGMDFCPRERRPKAAHRVSYERVHGPIPAGLVLDHHCKQRCCVRPEHLEAVTERENTRRSNRCVISMEIAREIRASPKSGLALAEHYGVSAAVVSAVRCQKTWREDDSSG